MSSGPLCFQESCFEQSIPSGSAATGACGVRDLAALAELGQVALDLAGRVVELVGEHLETGADAAVIVGVLAQHGEKPVGADSGRRHGSRSGWSSPGFVDT